MSDTEDPYAVSSDSEDEEKRKGPPPKINIEGRLVTDLNKFKETLTKEKGEVVKDEERLKEIEELTKGKGEEMKKVKKDFEEGKHLEKGIKKENEPLEGVGKENLVNMKEMFEKAPNKEYTKEKDALEDLIRTETDKKRILAAFEPPKDEPTDCALCNKIVYPVERLVANKKLYHNNCFRCSKCNKKLTPISYNIHEGILYCKPHVLEVLHPGQTGSFEEDDDEPVVQDEDEEFAVVSKPKHLSSQVVRAGQTNIGDELAQLRSLKETKANLESSISDAQHGAEKRISASEEIASGNVKAFKEKLSSAPDSGTVDDDEKKKQLDEIRAQVSEVKNRWKTGDVEKAETKDAATKDELEELKKGLKVKERFNLPSDTEGVTKSYDRGELDTASIAEARKSFLEGSAFQTGPVEKTAKDLDELKFGGLNSFKERFEKGPGEVAEKRDRSILDIHVQLKNLKASIEKGGEDADMTPEERAEHKKKEIEAEFLRYKLARKLQAKKAKDQPAPIESSETDSSNKLDVEIKMAGKAREKFKNIDAQNPHAPIPTSKSPTPSKWDTKKETTAEIVNRRAIEESSSEEDEGEFDVKNLMNKFKNIETTGGSKVDRNLDELEALRIEAKNLREKFEKTRLGEKAELTDEKQKQLEEEFKLLKEERERAQRELQTELEARKNETTIDKEEIQIAADHASKMSAKFEKIIKKETKKAEKSKLPAK